MCGIAGILTFDGDRGRDSNREIAELTNALAHRGPDGVGFYHGSGMDLGHRRLAIIDLDTGAQPMSDPSESVWITFNGEIYNYREVREELKSQGFTFRTDSDTEVFLHGYQAWGERCLGRLRGMFAVAIWDARQDRLFLARDRVGIKPLYYLRTPSRFAFASEVHAFHALEDFEATLDPAAIDLYLHFQYIPAPLSAYR